MLHRNANTKKAAQQDSILEQLNSSNIMMCDLRDKITISPDIKQMLADCMIPYVSAGLFCDTVECIRGYDIRVQLFIVEALGDYLKKGIRKLTKIEQVDAMLLTLYDSIDNEICEM